MHKKDIFDLYNEQHKNDPAPENDTMPGEVKQADITPPEEVPAAGNKDPEPAPAPDPKQEEPEEPEKGAENEL